MICFTNGVKDEEGKEKIVLFHFQPEKLTQEKRDQGYEVPAGSEEPPANINYNTHRAKPYYNTNNGEVTWEIIEINSPSLDE